MDGIEHPDITHARATGYPAGYREPPPEPRYVFLCSRCDCPVYEDDYYYQYENANERLCMDCIKEVLLDKAHKFNF
jgi:hypothetical protein